MFKFIKFFFTILTLSLLFSNIGSADIKKPKTQNVGMVFPNSYTKFAASWDVVEPNYHFVK